MQAIPLDVDVHEVVVGAGFQESHVAFCLDDLLVHSGSRIHNGDKPIRDGNASRELGVVDEGVLGRLGLAAAHLVGLIVAGDGERRCPVAGE